MRSFRRITYSTSYLPEIDGLRFLAIFSVVVIMHITNYLDEKFYGDALITNEFWENFVLEGGNGVSLFFVISGFILSLPFAKWRLRNEKRVILRNYFLRRVTRLEPPYIIALLILFVGYVWVLEMYSFSELIPRLIASIFYLHTIIYNEFPWVLPVAWSLEVEVQFYILAPFFCLVFLIKKAWVRWLISTSIILLSAVVWFDYWHVTNVFNYLHYFFMGILLSDLYTMKVVLFRKKNWGFIAGLLALTGFIFIPSINNFYGYLVKIACMFFLIHTVLTVDRMKKIFSVDALVIIGGMCYSIYLLHFAIISLTGQLIMRSGLDYGNITFVLLYAFLMIILVVIISGLYFLLIEKPFMKPFGLPKQKKAGE